MKERIPINPEILKWARESVNIPIEDVALGVCLLAFCLAIGLLSFIEEMS